MSDVVITHMSLQEELNEGPNIKCAEFASAGNKMQCAKKPEYKRVMKKLGKNGVEEKVDYLCQNHYQLLIASTAGKKHKVSH